MNIIFIQLELIKIRLFPDALASKVNVWLKIKILRAMNKSRITGLSCFIFKFIFHYHYFFFGHFVKIIVQLPHHRITIRISTTETIKIRLQLKLKSTWNTFTPIGLFLHIYFKIQYNTIQCKKETKLSLHVCLLLSGFA